MNITIEPAPSRQDLEAIVIFRSLAFEVVTPYYNNPVPGPRFSKNLGA